MTYSEEIPPMLSAMEQARKTSYLIASIGLTLKEDGLITDLELDSVAGKSVLAPGMKITSVNGRPYSSQELRSALKEGMRSKNPIEFQADSAGFTKKFSLDYHGGERYPYLVRDPARPDLLEQILQPLTAR